MKSRKSKKIITGIVIVILVIFGISQMDFKSVDTYKQEQASLLEEEQKAITESNEEATETQEKEEETIEVTETKEVSSEKKNTKKSNKNEATEQKKDKAEEQKEKEENTKKKQTTKQTKKKNTSDKNNKSKTTKVTKKPKATPAKNKKEETADEKEYIVCKVEIDCSVLLDHMDDVDEVMKKYIPSDGKILATTEIKVEKGKTAYDILLKACKIHNIACDAECNSLYSGCYVKGIGYLYEKKAGEMSGWLYQVNGKTPNITASQYELQEGDVVSWIYTCTGRAGS